MRPSSASLVAVGCLGVAGIAIAVPGLPGGSLLIAVGMLVAPGIAIGRLAGIRDALVLALVVVPVSLALAGLLATAMLYLGVWSAELSFAIVAVITLAGLVLASRERRARGALVVLGLLPGVLLIAAGLSAATR
jgi:hypothetical protein